ncbi:MULTISPECIES: fumarate reductase/succinate dehydrogenase flavoprotein subunit [Prochlorococcus]|uniref:succinate dehydrogenase n=1 Tax=Prochlorococcus marinus (strain SARG / CCMP1375 / SS120) TaxID=167539 RepID=Q7VCP1_PROMA|nr:MULTISPECIES: fumarate reductase/succinate dehydrogenase flavoprotein subunit [Prochlorococcus]AAP99743.1 Succinate dehydrogenase flavoprotein subunit [Prochlorococcus marinus subsp. marinus str. CCMP1375]KGG14449.1 Succinate dehydrogenase flavoprotein subunit [Prochlorococcus marinus str. LG]KGG22561.1 Succinate dehydrogenase flavoprotein subunit [Prochlorococcus marinus str. SS2]KGG24404.1 Succinate dehydrogenase flavoprotein subunit [Prochlorococcus marinus str. SS35]KGG34176.1 Succinate
MSNSLDPCLPSGPLKGAWGRILEKSISIKPERKEDMSIVVVGSGLAGSAAAATLAEQGYRIRLIIFNDSPRRSHSVAAQGGINAARPLRLGDEDGIDQLFKDTLRGGDFRSREAGCQRLAEISSSIVDQCVAQGVPFAREYDGSLATRRFGGALISRTFYARGQTGQQLLYGAYQALMRQVASGKVELLTRRDVLELVKVNGKARGVVCRNLLNGDIEVYRAQAVILATGGYSNVYFLSTNSMKSNASAIWRTHRQGAFFANPCFTQIHPTCIPVGGPYQSKLTLMSESLRNDGRIWLHKLAKDRRCPSSIPEEERDYFLERLYPTYGNLVPRDVASRRTKELCDAGFGVGIDGRSVYLDLRDAILSKGSDVIRSKYGNLLEMYERIVGEDPFKMPMRIYPAPHYTMGGLWVDYNLMSTIPGLFVIGEANCTVHGANRLGANALLQCLSDGYFIVPTSITTWLAEHGSSNSSKEIDIACKEAVSRVRRRISNLTKIQGSVSVDMFHRKLGEIMINRCGITRNKTGLEAGLNEVRFLQDQFYQDVRIPYGVDCPNPELEKALRVSDFFELSLLMLTDALERNESCGAHFREEFQTQAGEAMRNDSEYSHIAAWQYVENSKPIKHCEKLSFTSLKPNTRSYK